MRYSWQRITLTVIYGVGMFVLYWFVPIIRLALFGFHVGGWSASMFRPFDKVLVKL